MAIQYISIQGLCFNGFLPDAPVGPGSATAPTPAPMGRPRELSKQSAGAFRLGPMGVPMGAPTGAPMGEMGENDLGVFYFLSFVIVFSGGGVYIISKWLIKVPGHIALFFG